MKKSCSSLDGVTTKPFFASIDFCCGVKRNAAVIFARFVTFARFGATVYGFTEAATFGAV